MTLGRQRIAGLADEAARRAVELDSVFAAAPDGVIIYDREGRIIRMNGGAERILDYSASEKARPLPERLAPGTLVDVEGRLIELDRFASARALRGETMLSQVVGLSVGSRPTAWLSFSAAPIVAPNGTVSGTSAHVQRCAEPPRDPGAAGEPTHP